MDETLGSKVVCPHCGESFYLPSDCKDHIEIVHYDFGTNFTIHLGVRVAPAEEAGTGANRLGARLLRRSA